MSSDNAARIVNLFITNQEFKNLSIEKIGNDNSDEIILILKNKYNVFNADEEDLIKALDFMVISDELAKLKSLNAKQTKNNSNFDLGLELQIGLINVIRQIDKGYNRVMFMYTVSFYLGVGLIIIAAVSSIWRGSDQWSLALGGLGISDLIAFMIFRPAQQLQDSRSDLAQLYAAIFNWINDIHNWDRYLQLIDRSTAPGGVPDSNKIKEVSEILVKNTENMMRIIEVYCESYKK